MNKYIVLYRIESMMCPADHPFGFKCYAEDADHAQEQCENAYPDCEVVWVSAASSYEEALNDYWGFEVSNIKFIRNAVLPHQPLRVSNPASDMVMIEQWDGSGEMDHCILLHADNVEAFIAALSRALCSGRSSIVGEVE